jgi:hypothetical protein
MNLFQRVFIVITFVVLFTFCYLLLQSDKSIDNKEIEAQREADKYLFLNEEIERLQRLLEYERKKLQAVESRVGEYIKQNNNQVKIVQICFSVVECIFSEATKYRMGKTYWNFGICL